MILLDTDHLSVFTDERDPRHERLHKRMEAATEPVACTMVSVEEVLRGWLAIIHRLRDAHHAYSEMKGGGRRGGMSSLLLILYLSE
jgi:predicted nucleic acid-binding protein